MTWHAWLSELRARTALGILGIVAVAISVAACGERTPNDEGTSGANKDNNASYPFEVTGVPDRYVIEAADRGGTKQDWDYEMGSDTPLTVVKAGGQVIIGSVITWEPMESELRWASRSGDPDPVAFTLPDGRPAAFGEGQVGAWNDLVVEVGKTEALRIAADDISRDELEKWATRFQSDGDRAKAPTVSDLPDGAEVVGSVQPDLLIALRAEVYRHVSSVPGPKSGYSIGWVDHQIQAQNASLDSLAVMVLPGSAGDIDALKMGLASGNNADGPVITSLSINKNPDLEGVFIDGSAQFGSGQRSVVTTGERGALVVVTAYGENPPSESELVAIATSVKPITADDWAKFQEEIFGGPRLVPDKGEQEITRGRQGDVEWLLQTITHKQPEGVERQTGPDTHGPLGPTTVAVNECLKLSNRKRACATPSGGGTNGSFYIWNKANSQDFDTVDLPAFALITTPIADATKLRLRIGDDTTEADLHVVPEGDWNNAKAAVVFMDLSAGSVIPTCVDDVPTPPEGLHVARIDLLDVNGEVLGCLGM
ncbi:MAG: hypothetical protein KDB26_14720 [Microthrixaceae bacterium]|nr:hypothetical protein [Microthrixaceae bacterium]